VAKIIMGIGRTDLEISIRVALRSILKKSHSQKFYYKPTNTRTDFPKTFC